MVESKKFEKLRSEEFVMFFTLALDVARVQNGSGSKITIMDTNCSIKNSHRCMPRSEFTSVFPMGPSACGEI